VSVVPTDWRTGGLPRETKKKSLQPQGKKAANHLQIPRGGRVRENFKAPGGPPRAPQRTKLARNPPRQCPVASVTSTETKPAAARRAPYSAMLGSSLARGTWANSVRIVIGNNLSVHAADIAGFSEDRASFAYVFGVLE